MLGITDPTASNAIRALEKEGVLREVTGHSWGRLYVADPILRIIDPQSRRLDNRADVCGRPHPERHVWEMRSRCPATSQSGCSPLDRTGLQTLGSTWRPRNGPLEFDRFPGSALPSLLHEIRSRTQLPGRQRAGF
jgi:hypothetical protein